MPEIVEKFLHLRKIWHLGPIHIVWHPARDHDIQISGVGASPILRRNGLNRMRRGTRLRKVHTTRGQIQVDIKVRIFRAKDCKPIKRHQFTAIDVATRERAHKIYGRHN